jgi:hypothetical protein
MSSDAGLSGRAEFLSRVSSWDQRSRSSATATTFSCQARTWVSLEPGWRVLDEGGALVVEHNGVRVQ